MKFKFLILPAICIVASCQNKPGAAAPISLQGTWELISGSTNTKGVITTTDYTKDQRMIKIINDTHFAFLKHPLPGKGSATNIFDAGGGRYTLAGDQYTESLDYYNDKNWEGKTFSFTVTLKNDTLIQKGIEKVEEAGVDRVIIEKYIRVKK